VKILYLTNGYKPHRWAGTETYTAGIAEEIARRNHYVEVICIGEWDKGDQYWNGVTEDFQNGIRVRRINLNWEKSPDPFRYLYDNPEVARYLKTILDQEKFDLVHVTSCETLSASIFQVVKNAGLPLVFSLTDFWMICPRITLLHSNGSNCSGNTTPDECIACMLMNSGFYHNAKEFLPEKVLLPVLSHFSRYPFVTRKRGLRGWTGNMAERKQMLKHALTLPDYRITASNFVRDVFDSNDVTVPIAVEPYGHDLGWLNAYAGKSDSNLLRLGYIGQIIGAKGVHLIMQALTYLPKNYLERLSVVIYGNINHIPEYGEKIKALASEHSNVRFGGTYQHAESARIYSEIDILVVPSLWFDFPLIIYEALASQTPVIATNLGGMAEAVSHGIDGLLFERGNAEDLALQIRRLLDEPGLLEQLRRGVAKVRTVQDEVDSLENKYLELVSELKISFSGTEVQE
jgi:glycosyltransferase involved in cell wall biosynthesis